MNFLYGKPLAEKILSDLKSVIAEAGVTPGLAVILIGSDPASHLYVRLKERAALSLGMKFERHIFSDEARTEKILEKIEALNRDSSIDGVIIQLPLPRHLDESRLVGAISPAKDADGFHENTLKRYFAGEKEMQPVFPRAITHLIQSVGEELTGKKAVAIVNSELFGRVVERALADLELDARVFLREQMTSTMTELYEAKVVVVACGTPGLIRGEMLSPGAIIIDGGITRVGERVLGDVDLESVTSLSGWITPVPGGVGPVTVATLLARVAELSLKSSGRRNEKEVL